MPFAKIITAAYHHLVDQRRILIRVLARPFIAILVVDIVESMTSSSVNHLILGLLHLFATLLLIVTTHRIILLGESSVNRWGIVSWTKRETIFLLYSIGLALILTSSFSLYGFIDYGRVILGLASLWIISRLSLVFPGVAVDKGITFRFSWKLTQNYQGLMFLVVVIIPILLVIPLWFVTSLPFGNIIFLPVSILLLIFEVALLSTSYQYIVADFYGKG